MYPGSRPELIIFLAERDGFFCFICKGDFKVGEDPTIDHWIPLSKGGTWEVENLRLSHELCNHRKSNLMPNPDGTIPKRKKELKVFVEKHEPCETCMEGRLLLENEECPDCGLDQPQPRTAPKYLQRQPKDCQHGWGENPKEYCWGCFTGLMYERKPSIDILLSDIHPKY